MSLVEIARFADVYEADLALGFLRAHGVNAELGSSGHAKIDPLMQQALGWARVMVPASQADEARTLLSEVRAGEHALQDGDDIERPAGRPGMAAMAAGLLVGGEAAMGALAFKRRRGLLQGLGLALIALSVVLVITSWVIARS